MWRRSAMLQKKLQELESELSDVFFRHPPPDPDRMPLALDDIKHRFSFLTKLLAAEFESSQPQTSDQLREIDQRLTQLKAAFRDWKKSSSSSFSNHDDTPSICSDCTQAQLLYDEDEDEDEDEDDVVDPDKYKKEEMRLIIWRSKMGKYCGVFCCGMIVGAICMALKLYFSSHHEYQAVLLPPT